MDFDYVEDGGANAESNVNNNLNSDSLCLKSSEDLLKTNNNKECLIMEESDPREIMNGIGESEQTQKNSPGETSLCTITNQINGDLAVEIDKFECKPSPKEALQFPMPNELSSVDEENNKFECKPPLKAPQESSVSNELNSVKEESLVDNGSSTSKSDMCVDFVADSEKFAVDQANVLDNISLVENGLSTNEPDMCAGFVTHSENCAVDQANVSDNVNANEKTDNINAKNVSDNVNANEKITCIEKLAQNVSDERKLDSNSSVDIVNCSENTSDICASAADSNLTSNSNTLLESIPVKSDVPETPNAKSNEENSSAADSNLKSNSNTLIESIPVKSDVLEISNAKSNDESLKTLSIPTSSETLEVLDESVSEEEVYVEIDEIDEQESDLSFDKPEESRVENEKENIMKSHSMCDDISDSLKTNDLVNECKSNGDVSMNNENETFSEKENVDEGISESEIFAEIDDLSEKESMDLETDEKQDESLLEKSPEIVCSKNLDIESSQTESKSESSNIVNHQVQSEMVKKLCENDSVLPEISPNFSDVKTSESDIANEENSPKNVTDMETSENAKTNGPDDFLVLSDIEWSDDEDDVSEKHKIKVEEHNLEKENVQNEQECSEEKESQEDTLKENPGVSSDGDDFDLDDVIEEFAKEENKIVKLSDDELDDLVEEFVEAECSSPSAEKNKEPESKDLPSESDDEMELLIEDFKAVDSDNDCFIVQDGSNVVIVDDKDTQPKRKKSKSNDSQSCFAKNSNDSTDTEIKSDAILSSYNPNENPEPETSSKVSKIENISVQKNEVVNNETHTEKNNSFENGSFKPKIFGNEAEGNKQNKGSILLEVFHKSNNECTKKAEISLSSLPISEKLTGEKVTVECRTDGVFLVKEQNTVDNNVNLHGTNVIGEKRNFQTINTVASNNVSSCYNKLSEDQSVVNSVNSDSIAEEQCMDDILDEVCASNNSTNNEECKRTAVRKESEMVHNSVHLEEKHISPENGEVKSLGSLCHDNLEESKKRKLEILDNETDEPQKKIKMDNAKAEDLDCNMDTAPSSTSRVDESVRKKVLEHFNEAFPTKVQLKKSWLEKLCKRLCHEALLEEHKQEISQQNILMKDLEEKLQALEDELHYSRSQASMCVSVQQELFQKHHFIPQTAVRTVAVNVKIFRECDVPQPAPLPAVTEVEVPTHTTEIHGSTPVLSTPPIKVQVPQQKSPVLPVQQTAVPQTMATARFMSNPNQSRPVITTSQRFVPFPPNITVTKKELVPGMSNSQSVPSRSLFAQKSQPPTKTCSQLIDLTDEESLNKKLLPASSTLVSIASNSVPKVNLPGLQNNQNVLFPLNGLFQMVPASTQNNSQFSLSNPVQVQQVSRQALVPSLPTNLIGPRTVAYIIPSNSGQINTIGRNSLPVSNFVSGSNQRLQTLIVRVTNPGQAPTIGTVINSNARMPVLSQGLKTTSIRNSSIPSSASDLVLFPRQPKHPAPFPALPEYRPNPQLKALPPKPSLKGSKAPNGIILSWNMSLINLHAEISNYQLFAYQETSGPVNASLWKKVGDVKALPLPMACTLTQFIDGNRYYFTVRAVDVHNRFGPYSDAVGILFSDAKDNSKSSNKQM